jgi:uncharacterized SAM-binding protein YcdF (DUF218 family)
MSDVAFLGSKLLQEAIYPFNWSLLCLLLGLSYTVRGRRKTAIGLQSAGLILLVVPSMGYVSEALMMPLESTFPVRRIDDYAPADLIVLLGGTTGQLRGLRIEAEEMRGARVQAAARLYRAGKGKQIIVSGGHYVIDGGRFRAEAEDMRDVLIGMGVPPSAILMEANSRNTYENAAFTADLLRERGERKVLLVTSALHLPRAAALFRKQGVDATPVPCSFLTGAPHGVITGLKPTSVNVLESEAAIKEYVGRLVYWVFGKA